MPLTLQERERIAYIEGCTEEARLCRLVLDNDSWAQQKLVEENRCLREEIHTLNKKLYIRERG